MKDYSRWVSFFRESGIVLFRSLLSLFLALCVLPGFLLAQEGRTKDNAIVLVALPFEQQNGPYTLASGDAVLWFLVYVQSGQGLVLDFSDQSGAGSLKAAFTAPGESRTLEVSKVIGDKSGFLIAFTSKDSGNCYIRMSYDGSEAWRGMLKYYVGSPPAGRTAHVPGQLAPSVAPVESKPAVVVEPKPAPVVQPVEPKPAAVVEPKPAPVVQPVEPKPAAVVEPKPAPVVQPVEPKPAAVVEPKPAPVVQPVEPKPAAVVEPKLKPAPAPRPAKTKTVAVSEPKQEAAKKPAPVVVKSKPPVEKKVKPAKVVRTKEQVEKKPSVKVRAEKKKSGPNWFVRLWRRIQSRIAVWFRPRPREAVKPAVVDIRSLKFSKTISGFDYKSWSIESARVCESLDDVLKEILPLIRKIEAHPEGKKTRLRVIGHTDGIGPEEPVGDKPGNVAISRARARAVAECLAGQYGFSPDLFEIIAKGSSEPLPGVKKEHPRNRRVVVLFDP